MNQNKTTKYFKYAIGEIVLVVIGILIALQINNWNEQRKNNNKELYLLQHMQKEFKQDSLTLMRFIFLTQMKAKDGKQLRRAIKKDTVLSNERIVVSSFFNGRVVLFNDYTPTFNEIVASGNLSIIESEELKNKIKRYKSYISQIQSFMYYEAQRRKETYNTHLYKYFEAEIMTSLWLANGSIDNLELNDYEIDIDGFFNDPETLHQINIQIGVDRELQDVYETNYKRLLNNILVELQIEIDKVND